jgi:hypothetical protein
MALQLRGYRPRLPTVTILHPVISICFDLLQKTWLAKIWDTDIKQAAISWLQTLDTDFFYARIQALDPRWS